MKATLTSLVRRYDADTGWVLPLDRDDTGRAIYAIDVQRHVARHDGPQFALAVVDDIVEKDDGIELLAWVDAARTAYLRLTCTEQQVQKLMEKQPRSSDKVAIVFRSRKVHGSPLLYASSDYEETEVAVDLYNYLFIRGDCEHLEFIGECAFDYWDVVPKSPAKESEESP
ncbi:hypothetical protein ACFLSJ_04050 [Verrucomicrobiota bacterium]